VKIEDLNKFLDANSKDAIIKSLWKQVKKKKNVHGYSADLQPRIKNGEILPNTLVFRVYVNKKEPASGPQSLECNSLVPRTLKTRKVIDDVDYSDIEIETDVVEVPNMHPLARGDSKLRGKPLEIQTDPQGRHRPVIAGVSGMAKNGSACTVGWFARDKKDNHVVIVVNNHCAANENKNPIGHPYLQPSPYDGGCVLDECGMLKRFVPIKFDSSNRCWLLDLFRRTRAKARSLPSNQVDIAIVEPNVPIEGRILCIGEVKGKRRGQVGEHVYKCGRTTGFTSNGILIDNNYISTIEYSDGAVTFGPCGLIQGRNFSDGGDSSSAIVFTSDNCLAGILFAGSDGFTIFCHYDEVERLAEVEFLTSAELEQYKDRRF
jgi:hypothetical protein